MMNKRFRIFERNRMKPNANISVKPRQGANRASMPPARQANTHSARDNSSWAAAYCEATVLT